MCNTIYLMMDRKYDHCLFKVGFAKDMDSRSYAYTTHNPEAKCIDTVKTYSKTKREVEKMFHAEIESMGFEWVVAGIDNKRTEWFIVDYANPFCDELMENGFKAFKNGKRRKSQGEYKVVRL